MTCAPLVSVIIPAYNRASCVSAAVASAVSELANDGEIVVVDDGSADDTAEAATAAGGDLVRLIRHEVNRGASAARNTAVQAARGRFLAFLDSDDVWLPGKLATQLAFMESTGAALCCTGFRLVRPGGRCDDVVARRPVALGLRDLAWGCYVAPGTTLVARRELFVDTPFRVDLKRYEDWDWFLRHLTAGTELAIMPAMLAEVRVGAAPAPAAVRESLAAMVGCHLATLERLDPVAARHFRAGAEVELAGLAFRNGEVATAVWHILRTLGTQPLGNRAFRHVVLRRLAKAVGAWAPGFP